MKPLYKILIIAGVVVVATLVIYFFWQSVMAPEEIPEQNGAALPSAGIGAIKTPTTGDKITEGSQAPSVSKATGGATLRRVSESSAFDLWVVEGTGDMYYLTLNGKVMNLKEGPDVEVSAQTVSALNRAEPAPGGGKILAAFGDPKKPQWAYFDIIDGSWHTLPGTIVNSAWAGKSDQLIAFVRNGTDTNLSVFDLSKNPPNQKVLLQNIALRDVTLWFQAPEQVVIAERPSAFYASRVWRFDIKTSSWNLLLPPERGLIAEPVGESGVILRWSSADRLFITDRNFERGGELNFSTLPEKCAAATEILYCFVPRESFPQNLSLPDAYYQKKFFTTDSLVRMAFASSTLEINSIDSPWASTSELPVDAKNPRFTRGNLYFINRYDGYIYELGL